MLNPTSTVSILSAGVVAGALHVLMGPDHLVAVAPLAINQNKRSWLLGVRWGVGHASGVIFVAILAWTVREFLPVELFSSHCERLVGVMLVAIGFWGLRKALKIQLHTHGHTHDGSHHLHIHSHNVTVPHDTPKAHTHTHTALAVGILHGLAGGSHFLGVLPALAMPSRTAATCYLLSFGVGTIIAMAGFSFMIGELGRRTLNAKYFRVMVAAFSSAAIILGGVWLVGT